VNDERRFVEIRFVRRDGTQANPCQTDQHDCFPVMEVVVFPPDETACTGIHGLALVDTGCDYVHVAAAALDRVSTVPVREVSIAGVTGDVVETHACACIIKVRLNDGTLFPVHCDAVRSSGISRRPYIAVIGRSVFRSGCLLMDYRNRIFRFFPD